MLSQCFLHEIFFLPNFDNDTDPRTCNRIPKVIIAISELENKQELLTQHISEAIQYRNFDRELWNH